MSPADDEEDTSSWKRPERQLRSDGRMTGDLPVPPPAPASAAPAPPTRDGLPTLAALTTGELQLSEERAPPSPYVEPGPYRPAPAPPRRALRLGIVVVTVIAALGFGALALFALRPGLQRALPLPAPIRGTVMFFSEPSGATVRIADVVMGVTPYAADNLWSGEVKYEVSAPGRQSKRGTFQGGNSVQLNLKLPRK